MIITIKGADFSSANIGTLNTVSIKKVISKGVSHEIPNFVTKGSSVTWTLTLEEDYKFDTYSVTMGSTTITPVVNDNIMTITIPQVINGVTITITTINESTGGAESTVPSFANEDFEVGGIGGDGVSLVDMNTRYRQKAVKLFDRDVTVSPTILAGATTSTKLRLFTYSSSGTKETDSDWVTTPLTISANTHFKLTLQKHDGTAVADKEFINVTVPTGATKMYFGTLKEAKDYSYVTYNGTTYYGTEFIDGLYHYNSAGKYATLSGSSKMASYPNSISVTEGTNVIVSVYVNATLGWVFTDNDGNVLSDSTGVSMPQRAVKALDLFTYDF